MNAIEPKPQEKAKAPAVGPWYFGIAHHSTRLSDLALDVDECDALMRLAIMSLAQWSIIARYDLAETIIDTHNFNQNIFVINMHGIGQARQYPNVAAARGEVGFLFLDHNPNAADVLRSLCEWWLRLSAADSVPPEAPGRKVIWQPGGRIVIKYISPFEDFEKAQVM